jgi:hypothetical protein
MFGLAAMLALTMSAAGQAPRAPGEAGGCCGMCAAGGDKAGAGCRMAGAPAATPIAEADAPKTDADKAAVAPAEHGMSAEAHETIFSLLTGHAEITRTVEEVPGGVRTTTTTSSETLAPLVRLHVRQMAENLRRGRVVRMWDPVFRDVFAHHEAIRLDMKDVPGGVEVTETSDNPEAVAAIRAHAKKVSSFVSDGHAAARPPWAGGGRGRGMGAGPGGGAGAGNAGK